MSVNGESVVRDLYENDHMPPVNLYSAGERPELYAMPTGFAIKHGSLATRQVIEVESQDVAVFSD